MAVASNPSAPGTDRLAIAPLDIALLGTLALAWGAAYIFIREGIVHGASPLLFAAVRYGLSAVAFAALAAIGREALPGRRAVVMSAAIGGPLVIGLYGGFLYWGEQFTTGGYASVLSSTAPILTVVAAFALLPAERLAPVALAGLGVGFVGAVVLVLPDLAGSPVGVWPGPAFILAAFVCAAVGTVLLRRFGGGRQGRWQIATQFAVAAALLAAIAAVLPDREALPLSVDVLGALAVLVVVSSVLGYFVYFWLHHRVGPVRANVVAYLLPLVGIGLGSGLFGEPVTWAEVVGFAIVLGGVTLVVRGSATARPAR